MKNKLLSILIPTLPERHNLLFALLREIHTQAEKWSIDNDIEIIIDSTDSSMSIGNKRQQLLEKARGEYIIYLDDDDEILNDLLWEVISAIKNTYPDVIGYNGYMTTNGMNRENFKIMKDLPYITIMDSEGHKEYLRHNNHLSPIKREIALKIGYRDMHFQEDFDYSVRLKNSGLVKSEHYINLDLYHYKYKTK